MAASIGRNMLAREITVSAVMPCLNEAASLPACIRKIDESFRRLGLSGEIIVADNGSTDGSIAIAEELGARVVHVSTRGYGAALIGGITAARGEIIIMADADGSYDWGDIGIFVDKINQGYDMVIGNRFKGGIMPGAMPPLHRYLGNPVLSAIARLTSKAPVGDFHCGMRAFTRAGFEKARPSTTGMELATEMVMNAVRNGARIAEIPIKLHPDTRGRRPHLRTFRDGWRHLRFILMYAPDYLFLAPAMLILLPGILLVTLLAPGPLQLGGLYFGTHFMALGMMLVLLGVNLLSLAITAKLILSARHPLVQSRLVRLARADHFLERGLAAGAALTLAGLLADGYILYHWLRFPLQPMDSTVHPALAASTMIAVGMSVVFSSFMLHIVNSEQSRRND